MKKNTLRTSVALLPLLALALPGHGQSTPLPATSTAGSNNSTTEEVVALPEFSVSSEKADRYRAEDTVSLARVAGALIDTPVSINVVPKELIQDLGANSTYEASRYMAGVSNGRGAGTAGGINDRTNFRGFESQTRTVDNFSSTFIPGTSTSIDTFEPAFIERVEIVLGPDAILNPTGTPGGSMNVVSKSPLFNQQGYIEAQVGNYSAQKFTIDTTGPIPVFGGNKLAYRVIATGQDTKTYIPGDYKKYDLAVELAYKFNAHDILTFKYFGVDFRANSNASAPNDNGWLVYDSSSLFGQTLSKSPQTAGVKYNGNNGVDTNSSTQERTNTLQLVYTGTLFDLISVRLGGQLLQHHNIGDSAFPTGATGTAFANSNSSPSETFDLNTGQVNGLTLGGSPFVFDPTAVTEVWRYNNSYDYMYQFENDYAANFNVQGVSIQPIAGVSFQHDTHPFNRTGTATMPQANLLAGDYNAPRPDIHLFTFGNRSRSEATQRQLYGVVKTGFIQDHVFLMGGATREWVYSQSYTYNPSLTAIVANGALPPLNGFKDSYIGSVLVKPVDHVSLYYTFSTNNSVTALNPGGGITVPLWSQGREHEFGFKSEWLNQRLSINGDHFQMAQTNVSTPNPLANIDPVHQPGNIFTNNANHGFELNVIGGVTKNLSLIASYTRMKYRDAFGRRVRNVPDDMENLLANYHFTQGALKNFNIFGAVERMGQTAGESQTGFNSNGVTRQVGFYVAAWTVFNAGAGYTIDRYRFNLNVDNVLNSKFAWEPASRLSVSPYPGITVRLTTTVKF